jgi:hypothetical protein
MQLLQNATLIRIDVAYCNMYEFDKTISDLIEELTKIREEHGNIFVEGYAEGCFCGCTVTYCPEKPDTLDFRGHSNDDGIPEVVLIGERVYGIP